MGLISRVSSRTYRKIYAIMSEQTTSQQNKKNGFSLTKTLAITTAASCVIANQRSLFDQILQNVSYNDTKMCLLAGYTLNQLSEVETRFGSKKFLNWALIQFLLTIPIQQFGVFSGHQGFDWLIYGLLPIHFSLSWQPRSSIFNFCLLLGQLLTNDLSGNLSLFYLIFSGILTTCIVESSTFIHSSKNIFKKLSNKLFSILDALKIFSLIPETVDKFLGFSTNRPEYPFMATSSWRRQETMEKIERAQMQAMQQRGAQVAAGNMIRRAAGGENQRVRRVFQLDQAKLATLTSMGFREDRAKHYLERTNNDLEQATNFLLAEA